jgi:hypothetical protein
MFAFKKINTILLGITTQVEKLICYSRCLFLITISNEEVGFYIESTTKMKTYKLMASLFAHTGDVKCLSATRDNGGFVSVSRDLSAKLWLKNEYI